MKKSISFWLLVIATICQLSQAQGASLKSSSAKSKQVESTDAPQRTAFSNLGVSLDASVAGFGFTLSTPIARNFVLRGGYRFSPINVGYTYDDFEPMSFLGINFSLSDLHLDGDLRTGAAHIMVDWIPFKRGRGAFFVTAGLFVGSNNMLDVQGQFDMSTPDMQLIQKLGLLHQLEFEVGDMLMHANADGSMNAKLGVNVLRPYVGIGWGRAIPHRRVGFRFELGASFHGQPEIISDNLIEYNEGKSSKEFYGIVKDITVLPQLSLQLTYRIFRDK